MVCQTWYFFGNFNFFLICTSHQYDFYGLLYKIPILKFVWYHPGHRLTRFLNKTRRHLNLTSDFTEREVRFAVKNTFHLFIHLTVRSVKIISGSRLSFGCQTILKLWIVDFGTLSILASCFSDKFRFLFRMYFFFWFPLISSPF